jgi:hypothetical protein
MREEEGGCSSNVIICEGRLCKVLEAIIETTTVVMIDAGWLRRFPNQTDHLTLTDVACTFIELKLTIIYGLLKSAPS